MYIIITSLIHLNILLTKPKLIPKGSVGYHPCIHIQVYTIFFITILIKIHNIIKRKKCL